MYTVYRSFVTTVSKLKIVIFQEKLLKVLKCYNFLLVQQRHNCSPVVSFANCIMTLYLLKVHLHCVEAFTPDRIESYVETKPSTTTHKTNSPQPRKIYQDAGR